jgi:ribosomal protein S18 acetylase RimI-like enzyme
MIRSANLLDVPWLLDQLREFDQFFGAKKKLFPRDTETATTVLEGLITNQPFFIAADTNGRQGFIAGALTQHPYNPELLVLWEMFWWVAPEYRGSTVGARLLHHFMEYGKANEADWIRMTLETGSPVNPKSLERLGFSEFERGYLWEAAA